MVYKKTLIGMVLSLCLANVFIMHAISLAPQEVQVNQNAGPATVDATSALQQWFTWFIANPTGINEDHLNTLETLISQAQVIPVGPTEINALYNKLNQLSPAGKQIFPILASNLQKLSLNDAQAQWLTNTANQLSGASTPTAQEAPVLGADQSTWSPTTQQPQKTSKKRKRTSKSKAKSYAKDIKAVMKKKKASKILPGLIKLLDQTMGQQVDAATIKTFTKAINNITKKSNKFGQKLRQQFATLIVKAYHSNFTTKNQKAYLQQLYQSVSQPQQQTRRRR